MKAVFVVADINTMRALSFNLYEMLMLLLSSGYQL